MITRQLTAFNTATESENRIHDDATAQRFGFLSGLVPGVEVHGYLSWGAVHTWGEQWLTRGLMTSRYTNPTYDGSTVTVSFDERTGEATVGSGGTIDASATCELPALQPVAPTTVDYPHIALPEVRPPASPHALSVGHQLGSIDLVFPDVKAGSYLEDVREELPIYRDLGIAHPGWVLGLANRLLKENVVLGPWIHVGSTVRNFDMVREGQLVSCRGHVAAQYEKNGHRFVELGAVVFADGLAAAAIRHIAIYEPRHVRGVPEARDTP